MIEINILLVVLSPIILVYIGASYNKHNPQLAKWFYILAVVSLVIGIGVCGSNIL